MMICVYFNTIQTYEKNYIRDFFNFYHLKDYSIILYYYTKIGTIKIEEKS